VFPPFDVNTLATTPSTVAYSQMCAAASLAGMLVVVGDYVFVWLTFLLGKSSSTMVKSVIKVGWYSVSNRPEHDIPQSGGDAW
jgi:hypothetical protein